MNKILFESERLAFREFQLEDAEAFYRMNQDEVVTRFTGDLPFASIEETEEFIRKYDNYQKQGFGRWAVIEKASGQFIGFCGLKRNEEDNIDLGYRLMPEKRGFGYATEAALATIHYGFGTLNLPEIIGRALKENIASIRVLEKCGMEFWKESTACSHVEEPTVYYRIFKP